MHLAGRIAFPYDEAAESETGAHVSKIENIVQNTKKNCYFQSPASNTPNTSFLWHITASIADFCYGFKLELVGFQQLSAVTLPFCVSMRSEAHIARFWLRQRSVEFPGALRF